MAQQEFYYKLIRPFQSNNVYLAHSLQSGAGKCFKEVIRVMPDTQQFSVMDINTNEIFDFNVNPPPISKELIQPNIDLSDIKEIRDKIDNLEERLRKLEMGKSMSSDEQVILLGGNNNNQHNQHNQVSHTNNLSVKTLSQVNNARTNNNNLLINKLNNGQNVNVDLAKKLLN